MRDVPFRLSGRLLTFEKAGAEAGQERRIAGVISTESRDRQAEIVLQDGLDFRPFLERGFFNDNHSKETDGIVGAPVDVKRFQKGERLPNGEVADTKCSWVEGYLFDTQKAKSLWELSTALQKSPNRALGFSIEGKVNKRAGAGDRIVAAATVTNCAVTNCAINTDTRVEVLAKSMAAIEDGVEFSDAVHAEASHALTEGSERELQHLLKALSAGAAVDAPSSVESGDGSALKTESLETDEKVEARPKKKKKLSKAEALELLEVGLSGVSEATLEGIVNYACHLYEARQAEGMPR